MTLSLPKNPGPSPAPLNEFLINIKEPLPTFSFSSVQNGWYASPVFVSDWEDGEDISDAGHFEPLDQHSDYKRGNGRKLQGHKVEAAGGQIKKKTGL